MPGPLQDVTQRFNIDSSGYDAGLGRMIAGNKELVKSIGDINREIGKLQAAMGGLRDRRVKVEVTGIDEAIGKVAALRKELDGLGDRHVHIGGDNGAMLRELRDISASMDMVSSSLGRMEDHMVVMKRDLADSSADLQMQTQMLRDNADAHHAAANAVNALAAANRGGGGDRYYIRTGGGGAGSGGGARGGGGGGGDLPGGGGAFVPWRGGGFQAVKFWGMAIAEFAATAVPALIAAGAASVVGMKGAEDVMIRAKAIGAAAASIGPAFGQSVSSYIGTSGALGRYQAAARGGVYELAGAGINFANMGKGQFGQLGLSTLAMIDRGTANMLINYRNRQAAGGGVGGLIGGGTEWLRRYGDLFSNLGSTVMNLAPYEPGLGGDVLNTLVGGTGLLKQITQDVPGGILGAIMAAEGGQRWGKALLGGKGLLGRVLGLGKVGGIGGLLGKAGGGISGLGESLFMRGMGGRLGGAGLGLMNLGEGIGGLGAGLAEFGGPLSIAAALTGYEISALSGYQDSAQRHIASLQAGVGQAGFSAAFKPLAQAIVTTRGLAGAVHGLPGAGTPVVAGRRLPAGRVGIGIQAAQAIGDKNLFTAAAGGFTTQMSDLIRSGPQLLDILHKAGINSVSMAQGFQIAQNALLDLNHAFDQHGKLNATAQQQLKNYVSAIGPMTRSGGGFNAAVEAQQIMSSGAMKSLSQVNQAMDSMTQIMSGGPAGMATLFGMLGGTPTKITHGGRQLAAPALSSMAKALTSFVTPGGAAAWNTFAGSQGLVAAEQQNLDQLRTAMTLGAVGQGGAAGLAGFQIQQLLPMARRSPAALAMLMQQGQQMGIGGYYDPSKSQAQNYAAEVKALAGVADNAGKANQQMNNMTVSLSRLPVLAKQFSQSFNADVMSKQVAAAASSFSKITSEAMKGAVDKGAISGLTGQLKAAFGGNMGAVRAQIQQALSTSGLSAGMQKKIMIQVDANVGPAQAKINGLHGKQITISATPTGLAGVQAAINAIHGKTVTITINTINRIITQAIGALTPAGGVAPATLAGGPANMRIRAGAQTGMKVPGYGGGDIVPAMLEPGELVVPKHAVKAGLVDHLRGRIPGFAGGGVAGQPVYGPSSYWGAGSQMAMWNPALLAQILAAMQAAQGGGGLRFSGPPHLTSGASGGGGLPSLAQAAAQAAAMAASAAQARHAGSQFSVEILKGMHDGLKHAGPEARKLASALVGKLQQEVAYAKGVASSMKQGLNLAGMDVTPGTGQGTVQDQMQSYLGSMQAFSKDLGKLKKGHLNKDLMEQIVAAGPVQGDALAQSILGGPGGIKGANKLDTQIGKLANKIGAQAANAKYGDHLSPDLKSASMTTNNITVNVQMPAGHGGGDLQLTNQQINQLINIIQKKLLQQAKRNNKTGVKLPGKGS